MERITHEGSSHLPFIDFMPDGKLLLEGRSITEDATFLYNPLINFVDELKTDFVIFDINLEYFNTASSKKLLQLLKHLDNNMKINTIRVNWHFEAGDEDSVETAEIYEDFLNRIDFRYHEYAETL